MKTYVGDKDLHEQRQRLIRRDRITIAAKRVLLAAVVGLLVWAFAVLFLCM